LLAVILWSCEDKLQHLDSFAALASVPVLSMPAGPATRDSQQLAWWPVICYS